MTGGITNLRVRNNLTVDAYTGEATLANGTVVARLALSLEWPQLAGLKFGCSRVALNAAGGTTGAGCLEAIHDGTLTLTINSYTPNAVTKQDGAGGRLIDNSKVWWEFLGTAA